MLVNSEVEVSNSKVKVGLDRGECPQYLPLLASMMWSSDEGSKFLNEGSKFLN